MGVDGQYRRLVSNAARMRRFSVFGRPMAVVERASGRELVHLGSDGAHRPGGVPVPSDVQDDALATWLDDVFHECATPRHPDVLPLD